MLAGALVYVALVALIATTILSAALAMTRATIVRMARPYVAAGYQRASASLQSALAAQMQAGGGAPLPEFTPIPPACANTACTYTVSETIALTQSAAPTPGPTCDPAQTACAANVQTNAYVSESRVTATISVDVKDASGALVLSRAGTIVLRTFDTPPYVAIAGARDGAFDDVAASHAAGDDGGLAPATPDPCTSATPGAAQDTAVRVAYRNAVTNACTNGSSWGDASYAAPAASGWGSE